MSHRLGVGLSPSLRRGLALAGVVALGLSLAASGCRKPRERANTKAQQRVIDEAILADRPTPTVPVGAVLDHKLRLIGVDIDKTQVRPGEGFKVTWYWEAIEAAPEGWKVFVHFEGPGHRTIHDHHPVGELYPISKWEKGQIVKDEQTIMVADNFPNGTARLYVGVFDDDAWRERKQNVRMTVVNRDEVKTTVHGDGRIEVGAVRVGGKSAVAAPTYTAHRLAAPIVLDGRLDDAGWQGVPVTRPFVSPAGKALPASQRADARLAWDDEFLYVAFTCRDSDIWNDRKGRDATLWEQDVVEIYLDPGADGRDYIELQIAPTGELFDALFRERRQPAWQEAARNLNMPGFMARVDAEGSINVRDDGVRDVRWSAEVRIPWREIPGVTGAPAGQTWGLNLYRIGVGGENFMAAWTPVGGDFHNVADFGKITFSASPARPPRRAPPARRPPPGEPVHGAAPSGEPPQGEGPGDEAPGDEPAGEPAGDEAPGEEPAPQEAPGEAPPR